MAKNSTDALQEYIRYSRYAKYIESEQRRETWDEMVDRVMHMHKTRYLDVYDNNPEFAELFDIAEEGYRDQVALGSQRILQFAGDVNNTGAECPIIKHQARVFNCVTTALDRDRAFSEIMYMLLCGCGVGFSAQERHIIQLPNIHPLTTKVQIYKVEDSIEGWASAIGAMMASYFRQSHDDEFADYYGKRIEFDFSEVRPKGAYITGGFKAPGPDGLRNALNKIKTVFEARLSSVDFTKGKFARKLRTIDAYDIVMHSSDAVLSGGVRRSASICLFTHTDELMLKAKTGNWFVDNPQRARSNNSAILLRTTPKEEFEAIMESVKQFGEPGFIWVDDLDTMYNPCVEIGMHPFSYKTVKEEVIKKSGFQGCNLCEIHGGKITTLEEFLHACKVAAIIGTMQAGYTDFKFLTRNSKRIFDQEALLGISITGFMDNPDILLDPAILQLGAALIKEVNEKIAKMIGINPAARTTCVKPAGSTSAFLGTASGIHGHHAPRYIRHTQVNKEELPGQFVQMYNPASVEESVWSANGTDNVISFLVEAPKNAIFKSDLLNEKQLEAVKLVQQNWVEPGTTIERCVNKTVRHNVSNTVNVTDWDRVTEYIYENRQYLAGISFISHSGDKDYPQAPFTEVLTAGQILNKYGRGSMFASGLIVDGLSVFEGKLWNAIDTAIKYNDTSHFSGMDLSDDNIHNVKEKREWCERFGKFAKNYTKGDLKTCNYLLKDVYNLHKWNKIEVNYEAIDWSTIKAEETFTDIDTMGAIACSGGACEIKL